MSRSPRTNVRLCETKKLGNFQNELGDHGEEGKKYHRNAMVIFLVIKVQWGLQQIAHFLFLFFFEFV